jgi:secernin
MCDTMVVIGPDFVGFAKNSDRDPNEAQRLDWLPAGEHPVNSTVRCTWLSIPQASRTRATLLSRPFWSWGAEMGANDAGLVIGNEAVFTKLPFDEPGLTGMDLVRLALERATGVDEAIEVISDLISRHGQGGRCGYSDPGFRYHNSFLIADSTKAAVLESAGRHRAVELVKRGARAISNGLTLPPMQQYSDRLKSAVAQCHVRRMRMEHFGRSTLGPRDLAMALRDHGRNPHTRPNKSGRTMDTKGSTAFLDSPPQYRRLNGALSAPCVHYGGWLAGSQTVASWISVLQEGQAFHWATGTSAPCLSLFRPVSINTPRDIGAPEGCPDRESLWWRFEIMHRRLMRDWRASTAMRDARDMIETHCFSQPCQQDWHWSEADQWLSYWGQQFNQLADRRPNWLQRRWRSVELQAAQGNRLPARPAIDLSR